MTVPVRWLLSQPELELELCAGKAGLDNNITFAYATELQDPSHWLSGGELVITTGLKLPLTAADRERYVRGLAAAKVASLAFGVGVSYDEIPYDLVVAADQVGLPLLRIPYPTPFAAIVKRVMNRLAEQEYEAVLRASKAQPRMTRAVIAGGAGATVRELAVATSGSALLLSQSGRLLESFPVPLPRDVVDDVLQVLKEQLGDASSVASTTKTGAWMSAQQIKVGKEPRGHLVLITAMPLGYVDQILLGHANSLLCLDFEKPARLRASQNELNSHALGLLLSDARDLAPAWAQLRQSCDSRDEIRGLTVIAETAKQAEDVESAAESALGNLGRQLFSRREGTRVTVVLRGTDDVDFACAIIRGVPAQDRKCLRAGLSPERQLAGLVAAIEQSELAAAAAEAGAAPLEFTTLAGHALVTSPSTRTVLLSLADVMIEPIERHDRENGTELLRTLRAFLEANGHWESAASIVGVHRHTLRTRVAKIESLIDFDLNVARVRAEMLLAISARQVQLPGDNRRNE